MFKDFTETWKGFSKERIKPTTMILVVVNVVLLLISNIIAARAFEFGFVNGIRFALPIAMILYPAVLTISDVLAQTDWKWTRRSCHIGFALNLVMCGAFEIANAVSSEFAILHNTWYLLIASLVSFYFGDLVNDLVFKKYKEQDGEKGLTKRCLLSTLFGQLIDSSIFIVLGMHVLPIWLGDGVSLMSSFSNGYIITNLSDPIGWANVGIMIGLQIVAKLFYELLLIPLIRWICKKASSEEAISE
jgi:uncharacterized PurR-regulated membrane protein YhhQ (DUF165 family)